MSDKKIINVRLVMEVTDEDGNLERHPFTFIGNLALRFLWGHTITAKFGGYDGKSIPQMTVSAEPIEMEKKDG